MPDGEESLTLERLRRSYAEVLDATKHQDDKIGRLLAAIAFLTGGAIALGSRKEIVELKFSFDSLRVPLPAYLLGAFMITALTAVLLLVYALSGRLRPPAMDNSDKPSRLFFLMIASMSPDSWHDLWKEDASKIEDDLVSSYISETHNLAVRVRYKYELATLASLVLTIALYSLALAAIVSFVGLAGTLSWTLLPRIYSGVIIILFTGGETWAYLRYVNGDAQITKDPSKLGLYKAKLHFLATLAWAAPLYAFAVLPFFSSCWRFVQVGATVLAASSLRDPWWERQLARLFWRAALLVLTAGAIALILMQKPLLQFAIGGALPPLVLLFAFKRPGERRKPSNESGDGQLAPN